MNNIIYFFKTRFTPFLHWLPLIKNRKVVVSDLLAGLTWAFIVLPQWIAFASIAWLPPEYWLYTAMITPVIAAIFWSSFHLISGPTTAISLVVFSTISLHATPGSSEFISMALILTFLAWVYQLVFWLVRLWKIVDFVSHTVVVWFTAWAAILIMTSQIKYILWISIPSWSHFLDTWVEVFSHLDWINIYIFIVWFSTLVFSFLLRKFYPKIPNLLVGLIWWGIIAYFFHWEQNGIKFVAEISWKLPAFKGLDLSFDTIKSLASWAFAVALLWLIEAISISRSVASKSHQIIDANQEFIGQGLSNIGWSFFSCYAWSGSFTRSGVNYSAWAKTPLAAIFAAVFLALIVILIAPVTKYLPVAAMWGVIMLVGYWLINFKEIKKILKTSKSESSILLVTFFSTLFLELEFAIYFWIFLSLILFLNRTSNPDIVSYVYNYDERKKRKKFIWANKVNPTKICSMKCQQLEIIRIDMSIYFWSVNHIQNKIREITKGWKIKNILIIAKSINFIDMNGVEMLEKENHRLNSIWWGIYFSGLKTKVLIELSKLGFLDNIWKDNIFENTTDAIAYIYKNKIDKSSCNTCNNRIFKECGWSSEGCCDHRVQINYSCHNDNSILTRIVNKVKKCFCVK